MPSKREVRLEVARKLEHFACLLEEAAFAEGCEEACISRAADAAVELVKTVEAKIDEILSAEAEVNIEAANNL